MVQVGAFSMFYLSRTYDSHWEFEPRFLEHGNRRCGESVQVPWCVDHFFKTLKVLEEAAEIDLAIVFARANRANAQLQLAGDDVGDGLVFGLEKFIGGNFISGGLSLGISESLRAEEGTNVLPMKGKFHDV